MASGSDFKKEWFAKARVDYFSAFVNLWLACNSWYNFHYSLKTDREHIDKLKTDFTKSNKLFQKFLAWYVDGSSMSKEQRRLLANLEQLHFSLVRAGLQPEKLIKPLGFDALLLDYTQRHIESSYFNVVHVDAKNKDGSVKKTVSGIDLGEIVLDNNSERLFTGMIELFYQVRCMLVHGELPPTSDNHEVVKYSYLILHDLMQDFCS